MSNFIHLHNHSPYSLLDGFCKIDKMLDLCLEEGMDAVAITDHGNMFGAIEFYKEAKARGIKPIIGCEIYLADKQEDFSSRIRYHLILLAENEVGYHNLMKIVSSGYIFGYHHGKAHVDKKILKKYSEGIIALSACLAGECARRALDSDYEVLLETVKEYVSIFGKDSFFLEIQDHGILDEKKVAGAFLKVHKDLGVGLIATNDCHYLRREDAKAHDVLLCIQTGKTLKDENRMRFSSDDYYMKSQEEMQALFSAYDGAIENTRKVADRCNLEIEFHKLHLPHFDIPSGETNVQYFKRLVEEGVERRYGDFFRNKPEEAETVRTRASYEVDMISKLGYVDYFLIVQDFVNYAKSQGIPVGPGRGSAAGSIVSYALSITDIEPLKYNLLFERFLNPERVSMPDIDIDFGYERRDEVIEYVKKKYGEDRVAQIVTFGTMAAKNAIRDVGRVLDIPLSKVDRIAKAVPDALKMTLDRALDEDADFKNIYKESPENTRLIDLAREVEGMPRHTSTHAAGVLIASEPVYNLVPLSKSKDQVTTQYNMTQLEELGLLKMDFLGLRNLTVIQDAIEMVKDKAGEDIDIDNINLQDKMILDHFSRAETIGVFQFESNGMRAFLKELKPDRFEDLVAANALFRPGPMEQIPTYVKARHDPGQVRYTHPKLEPILKDTYGVIVYQEQVMQIVQQLAGYSLGGADNLRRAMSKKKMSVMEDNRNIFVYGKDDDTGKILIKGCVRNGIDSQAANIIYNQMIEFAKYAFNKSHSVAYAYVAMQTAYLKFYHPKEYFAALLTSITGNSDKVAIYLRDAENMGTKILRPNINRSLGKFTVEGDSIRFGLMAIKGVGTATVEATVKARESGGDFKDLNDYLKRLVEIDSGAINKKSIEGLIKAGAMDDFKIHRSQLMFDMEAEIESVQKNKRVNISGQVNMFENFEFADTIKDQIAEYRKPQLLAYEKEFLGVYLTDHPFSPYEDIFSPYVNFSMDMLLNEDNPGQLDGKKVRMAGLLRGRRDLLTKKQDKMCFVQFEDTFGMMEGVVFPRVFNEYKQLLEVDKPLLFEGRLQDQNNKIQIIVDSVMGPEELPAKRLFLRMNSQDRSSYNTIKEILRSERGEIPVYIFFEDKQKAFKMDRDFRVNPRASLIGKMKEILGSDNVILQ